MIIRKKLKLDNAILVPFLCLISLVVFVFSNERRQFRENCQSFTIDSVDYHQSGKDNTLQVSPYWKCHLKGTKVWVHVNENKEVGDSLSMIIKY